LVEAAVVVVMGGAVGEASSTACSRARIRVRMAETMAI
jgi:hypothetical protein